MYLNGSSIYLQKIIKFKNVFLKLNGFFHDIIIFANLVTNIIGLPKASKHYMYINHWPIRLHYKLPILLNSHVTHIMSLIFIGPIIFRSLQVLSFSITENVLVMCDHFSPANAIAITFVLVYECKYGCMYVCKCVSLF